MDMVVLESHQEHLELEFEGWFWAQAMEAESWLAADEEEFSPGDKSVGGADVGRESGKIDTSGIHGADRGKSCGNRSANKTARRAAAGKTASEQDTENGTKSTQNSKQKRLHGFQKSQK